ncbi:hypothetical protein Q7P37_011473 [Cladosporium fusiforme]
MPRIPLPPPRALAAGAFWITATVIAANDYLLEITPIIGSSMSPTLSPTYHTTGAVDNLAWRKWRPAQNLQRGDIVLYNTPHRAEGSAVKRVIALGGDTVILDPRRRPGRDANGDVMGSERTVARNWDAMAPAVTVPYGHSEFDFGEGRGGFLAVGEGGEGGRGGRGGGKGTRVVRGREVVPVEWEDLLR